MQHGASLFSQAYSTRPLLLLQGVYQGHVWQSGVLDRSLSGVAGHMVACPRDYTKTACHSAVCTHSYLIGTCIMYNVQTYLSVASVKTYTCMTDLPSNSGLCSIAYTYSVGRWTLYIICVYKVHLPMHYTFIALYCQSLGLPAYNEPLPPSL